MADVVTESTPSRRVKIENMADVVTESTPSRRVQIENIADVVTDYAEPHTEHKIIC